MAGESGMPTPCRAVCDEQSKDRADVLWALIREGRTFQTTHTRPDHSSRLSPPTLIPPQDHSHR